MADGSRPCNDPAEPNFVWAPSPSDRTEAVRLFVDPDTIRQMLDDSRNAALGQYAGLVHGEFAPVEGQQYLSKTDCLLNAVALFQGVMRPMIDIGRDADIFIYVTNPSVNYEYPAEKRNRGEWPDLAPEPLNSVFTTFVEFGEKAVDRARDTIRLKGDHEDVRGVIHLWEWTLRSTERPILPADYRNRYLTQVW